jgi:hypothetical protein
MQQRCGEQNLLRNCLPTHPQVYLEIIFTHWSNAIHLFLIVHSRSCRAAELPADATSVFDICTHSNMDILQLLQPANFPAGSAQ